MNISGEEYLFEILRMLRKIPWKKGVWKCVWSKCEVGSRSQPLSTHLQIQVSDVNWIREDYTDSHEPGTQGTGAGRQRRLLGILEVPVPIQGDEQVRQRAYVDRNVLRKTQQTF